MQISTLDVQKSNRISEEREKKHFFWMVKMSYPVTHRVALVLN